MDHDVEEKLRKLAPVDKRADLSWLFYLSGEGKERQAADELIDIHLFKKAQKDFREKIFLDSPNSSYCFGKYLLGAVKYPPEKFIAPLV